VAKRRKRPDRQTAQETAWRALSAGVVIERLHSDLDGLEPADAAIRLERHGPSLIPPPKRRGQFVQFAQQFHNVLIYVLVAAEKLFPRRFAVGPGRRKKSDPDRKKRGTRRRG
jgi:hypothetical protein